MAGSQQRYRGVRQRHWGSWVSEIRHPLLKTRIWLGTFETAEDAARAYDEAARLMSGPKTRMNFSYDESNSPPTKILSATLRAKLQRCHTESLKMGKKKVSTKGGRRDGGNAGQTENGQQFIRTLEDDDIEQMIEELLDYGSIELLN